MVHRNRRWAAQTAPFGPGAFFMHPGGQPCARLYFQSQAWAQQRTDSAGCSTPWNRQTSNTRSSPRNILGTHECAKPEFAHRFARCRTVAWHHRARCARPSFQHGPGCSTSHDHHRACCAPSAWGRSLGLSAGCTVFTTAPIIWCLQAALRQRAGQPSATWLIRRPATGCRPAKAALICHARQRKHARRISCANDVGERRRPVGPGYIGPDGMISTRFFVVA